MADDADGMDEFAIGERMRLSGAKNCYAGLVVSGGFEDALEIELIDNRKHDIGVGKGQESGESAVNVIADGIANLFGFVVGLDDFLGVAGAEEPAVLEPFGIRFNRQAADEAMV